MPLLSSLLTRFTRKQSPPAPPIINDGRGNLPSVRVYGGYGGLPPALWTQHQYREKAEQGYGRNADVYACISLVATAAKQVKWWDNAPDSKGRQSQPQQSHAMRLKAIYPKTDNYTLEMERKADDPTESLALFNRAGGTTFIERWVSYLLLDGNSFIELEREIGNPKKTTGPIQMLWLDRPDLVQLKPDVKPLRTGPTEWRVHGAQGGWVDIPAENIVQSKLFNPLDEIRGMAPLDAAMLNVDMQNEGATMLKRILQRGHSPGWIEAKENSFWQETQVAQLKERIRESKLSGEELFLENAKWNPIGFTPVESGFHEQKVLSKRDIAAIFHVPAQLIGDTQSQTFSNFREARRALYTEAVIPLLCQFRDDWNRKIGSELQSPLQFDRDSFDAITAAREEATDRVHKLWTSGLITQAEARSDLEYGEPEPGAVFYGPANFVPLATEADQE